MGKFEADGYFLSARNPSATTDQIDLEKLAMRIVQTPFVQQCKAQMAQRWKAITAPVVTPEAMTRFDELVEEFAFNYALKAANSDANYPRVLGHLYGPPHEWFGMKVPGSRGSGGDGPDHTYTIIPIDSRARYELHAIRVDPEIADVPMALAGNLSLSMTLGVLDWQDAKIGEDGRFVVTMDPEPANGRPNHIQTKLESRWLFIRDCRSDWRQRCNAYRIKRLDPPDAPPLTEEQLAERAGRFMIDDVAAMHWFMRLYESLEWNVMHPPFATGGIGGLVTQQISFARLNLSDDDAFVVTIGTGKERFRDIVLHDFWFRTLDYWNRTSNMNNAQGLPNADGSTTYVVSIKDPGVHNWLDPAGLHQLLMVHRWQGLNRDLKLGDPGGPWVKSDFVKLKDLDSVLPAGFKRVTPAERAAQLKDRKEAFLHRYIEN